MATEAIAELRPARLVAIAVECPACGFGLNYVPAGTALYVPEDRAAMEASPGGGVDPNYVDARIGGSGDAVTDKGYETCCESCAARFVVPRALVGEVQWRALVLLGEA